MKLCLTVTALAVVIATTAHAWSLPKAIAKGCATAATCAALMHAPVPAFASDETALKVDINAPFLLELVKTKEARQSTFDRANYLFDSTKNFVGPAVKLELPTDIKGVVKDALSGAATVKINGQDVGVKVVGSEKGSLTIQLSNSLLPALPLAGLPTTPGVVNAAADGIAEAAPGAVEVALNIINAAEAEPFWNRPIDADKIRIDVGDFHRAITPLDIVGSGSLFLGVVYAGSYAYYMAEQDRAAAEAIKNKEIAAAKQAAAAAKKKSAEMEAVGQ